MAPTKSGSPMTTNRVYLVHEHDARRIALRLVEQVSYTTRSNSYEHLHEL